MTGAALMADLRSLRSGDKYRVPDGNYQGPFKLSLQGEAAANIRITGGSGVRFFGDGGKAAPYCLRLDECAYLELGTGGWLIEECMGFEARGLQAFSSHDLILRDLTTRRIWLDDLHLVGCNDCLVERHLPDGVGDKPGRSGAIGAHAFYATCLDNGPDCRNITYRDSRAVNVLGACFQCNGDSGFVHNMLFERVVGFDYGQMGGAGFNLAGCEATLRDVQLTSKWPSAGGIRAFDGATASCERYSIILPKLPISEGPIKMTAGIPVPPQFVQDPSPAPVPLDPGGDLEEQIKTLQAALAGSQKLLEARRDVTDKLIQIGYASLADARKGLDKLERALAEAKG